MAERERPSLFDCPTCGTALVLLPLALYPGAAGWDSATCANLSGEIKDPDGNRVAMFTVVDSNDEYACPACTESFGPLMGHDDQRISIGAPRFELGTSSPPD